MLVPWRVVCLLVTWFHAWFVCWLVWSDPENSRFLLDERKNGTCRRTKLVYVCMFFFGIFFLSDFLEDQGMPLPKTSVFQEMLVGE